MSLITLFGRGHSGTRVLCHTLSQSGVFMGEPLNECGDLIPPEEMYEAYRILGAKVKWKGAESLPVFEFLKLPMDEYGHEGPRDG